LSQMGQSLAELGKCDEAVAAMREAIACERENITRTPHVTDYHNTLRRHYERRAKILKEAKRLDESYSAWDDACAEFGRLTGEQPAIRSLAVQRARTLMACAKELRDGGRRKEALARYQQALPLWETIVAAAPGHYGELPHCHFQIGVTHGMLGDTDRAVS